MCFIFTDKIVLSSEDFPSFMRENSHVDVLVSIDGLLTGDCSVKITIPSILFKNSSVIIDIYHVPFADNRWQVFTDSMFCKKEINQIQVDTKMLLTIIKAKLICYLSSLIEIIEKKSDTCCYHFKEPWLIELTEIRKEKLRKITLL